MFLVNQLLVDLQIWGLMSKRHYLSLIFKITYKKIAEKLFIKLSYHAKTHFKKIMLIGFNLLFFCRLLYIQSRQCTASQKKKKRNTPIYFFTNYRTERKLVPIIMDYCLLQFDALKFFLGVRLHRGGLNLISFFFPPNVNPHIFQQK